ncbi:MAG: hypothetical protein QOD42_2700 [Sphingomonadales bacterium]|jgi:hypothetical protein|nr:hypothetical protein [Sphingomonadales bacterium]
MRAIVTVVAFATLLPLCACGPGASPPSGQPPADISISTPQGKAEIRSGAAAAANWPEGVPPYPGAETGQSVSVTGSEAGQGGRILGFRTADTPQQVIAFYAQAIVRNGYAIANQMDLGQNAALTARRGQSQVLNITAHRAGDVTQVQIVAPEGR